MNIDKTNGRVTINGIIYGHISQHDKGYIFIPAQSGRKSSCKFHSTAEACIPGWVKKADRAYNNKLKNTVIEIEY